MVQQLEVITSIIKQGETEPEKKKKKEKHKAQLTKSWTQSGRNPIHVHDIWMYQNPAH